MYRQEILMNVTVSNTGEPAYSAELHVNIDPSFAYVGRSDDVTDIHCDFRGRGLGVRCLLGNPYASNRTDSLLFRVVPSQSSPFVQKTASFSVVANTSSEDIGETSDRTHEFQVSENQRSWLHVMKKSQGKSFLQNILMVLIFLKKWSGLSTCLAYLHLKKNFCLSLSDKDV